MFSLAQNYITRGFWGDEAWTSLISQLPYVQMLKTTAADFHPPAYYTVVEFWYKIFPPTEISTRLISVIFYLLTVFMVYKLVYFIAHPRGVLQGSSELHPGGEGRGKRFWGLVSAIVVLVNPIFFQYAFEARNYTMFAFAATGSIYFLVRILSRPTSEVLSESAKLTSEVKEKTLLSSTGIHLGGEWVRLTAGFVLFTTLGIYTHYYMFFTIFAQGLYLVIFDRKILVKIIGAYVVCGLLYLPWIPFLFGQVTSVSQGYWIGQVDGRTHYEALLRILGGEHQNIFRSLLFGLSLLLIIIGLVQHIRQKSFEKPYILIWLWATVPFVLASLPGLRFDGINLPFRPIFFWRYLIVASVPLAMVIVHAAQKLGNQLFYVTVGVVILLSLAVDFLTLARYPNTFKQVYANEIVGQIKPKDKIVTVLPSFAEVLYYRNRFEIKNDIVILDEGLVQFSGKSLLDAYVANGVLRIGEKPVSNYFELRPGPTIQKME